jgi:hypothetical protein
MAEPLTASLIALLAISANLPKIKEDIFTDENLVNLRFIKSHLYASDSNFPLDRS